MNESVPLHTAKIEHRAPKPLRALLAHLRWDTAQVVIAFFSMLFLISVGYRIALYAQLQHQKVLFGVQAKTTTFLAFFSLCWNDVTLVALFSAALWLLGFLGRTLFRGRVPIWWHWVFGAVVHLLLPCVLILYAGHFGVMTSMHTGLTHGVLVESYSGQGVQGLFGMMTVGHIILLFLPFAVFWVMLIKHPRFLWWRNRLVLGLLCFVVVTQLSHLKQTVRMAPEMTRNPVVFVVTDVMANWQKETSSNQSMMKLVGVPSITQTVPPPSHQAPQTRPQMRQVPRTSPTNTTSRQTVPAQPRPAPQPYKPFQKLSKAQLQSVRLIDPMFVDSRFPASATKKPKKKWNIVLIVLESTGTRYVFDTSQGNRTPMPFLKELSKKSWWMSRHMSPSNSSPRSVFSIFSGLFPIPQLYFFSMWPKNSLPSLVTMLGPDYDSFLVNPSPLRWYFPRYFLRASGLTDMVGYYGLTKLPRGPGVKYARDEREVTTHFIERIKRAKEPFFGTLCSFVPHWPYPDYGKEYRILPHIRIPKHRYYNNLALLDAQIKRVVNALKEKKLLKRTILVIVGDHGEAFGQHPQNYTHSRHSFNENFEVPALFYQPALFSPRVFKRRTTHVDIVPTLLDSLGLPYQSKLLQGESLWKSAFQRRYTFLFGNENTITSVSKQGVKLQISMRHKKCWVYHLKTDPEERRPLGCYLHREQMWATLQYRTFQSNMLRKYNLASLQQKAFHGLRHP